MYLWQDSYISALTETDEIKLRSCILEARSALEQRLLSPADNKELCAMVLAASTLDRMEKGPTDITKRITEAHNRTTTSRPDKKDQAHGKNLRSSNLDI
jgi:hypothetical protein